MTTTIIIVSCLLGVVSPGVLGYAFLHGIKKSGLNEQARSRIIRRIVLGSIIWVGIVLLLSLNKVFLYHEGDLLPRFLIALLVPVLAIFGAMTKASFRQILDQIPIHLITGLQFFRVFGAVFFFVALTGLGPMSFISSGYGDILTGLLAILAGWMLYHQVNGAKIAAWTFNMVGLFDLLNVSVILLINYPIWSDANPSTIAAGAFPLVLIVGITAPVALVMHVFAIRSLLFTNRQKKSKIISGTFAT